MSALAFSFRKKALSFSKSGFLEEGIQFCQTTTSVFIFSAETRACVRDVSTAPTIKPEHEKENEKQ